MMWEMFGNAPTPLDNRAWDADRLFALGYKWRTLKKR